MSEQSPETSSARAAIGIVVAMTRGGVIGRNGHLPWDVPADRRLFRQLTIGNTVVMGRRTFASLPAALPGRHTIVVSRSRTAFPGAFACRSLPEALALGQQLGRPIFVAGGTELYREALPLADTLYISWIAGEFAGDRHFPAFDLAAWEPLTATDHPGFRHVVYRRRHGNRPPPPREEQPPRGGSL